MSGVLTVLGLTAVVPWVLGDRSARRRCAALADAAPRRLPDARPPLDVTVVLELLGAALRAGAGMPRAIATVAEAVGGPDGAALAPVAAALRLGAPWSAAWEGVPSRLDVVARALRPAWDEGAAPGEALAAAGEELRRTRRDAARTAAGRLAVQLVLPLGACFLLAFVLVGLAPVLLALGSGLLAA